MAWTSRFGRLVLPVKTRVNFNIDRGFVKIDALPSDPYDENEDRVWNDRNADIYLLSNLRVDLVSFEDK